MKFPTLFWKRCSSPVTVANFTAGCCQESIVDESVFVFIVWFSKFARGRTNFALTVQTLSSPEAL